MQPDEAERKLKDWRWNKDHSAGTGICPLSNGVVHRLAVSRLKTMCLGTPRCSDSSLQAFFQNGAGSAVGTAITDADHLPSAPHPPADVKTTADQPPIESPRTDKGSRALTSVESKASSTTGLAVYSVSDDILRRVPPQNLEAEQSVLGAILLENSAIEEAIRVLKAGDFYRETHRRIFSAMLTIWQRRAGIDAVTLCQELTIQKQLQECGGPAYIAELAAVVPTARNIANYAQIVRDQALKREIAQKATWLASLSYDGVSVDALLGEMQRTLIPLQTEQNQVGFQRSTIEVFDWTQMHGRRESRKRDWVIEGMLARRETSSWSGKVEAGKTTLMRELALSVIRGEPFLGRTTVKGRVFYAMLDADGEDVTYDEFEKLGFSGRDADWCRFVFEPNMAQIQGGLEQFIRILKDFEPAVVIIDPYPRLKMIDDFHSYTNTYLMGMLSEVAKMIDAHLALPGHIPRGRSDDDDVATAGFGSIAFSGGVNARFVVTNRSGIHTIRSSAGKAAGFVPFEGERILKQNEYTHRIDLGDPYSWKDKGRVAVGPVAAFLAQHNDRPFDLHGLAREVGLQKSVVRTALGDLFRDGKLKREGEGLKGNPFIYSSLTYEGPMTLDAVKGE